MEFANVSLQGLQDLQTQILNLSKLLEEYRNRSIQMVNVVGQSWRDQQFDCFVRSLASRQEALKIISESYYKWATGPLQETINTIIKYPKSLPDTDSIIG